MTSQSALARPLSRRVHSWPILGLSLVFLIGAAGHAVSGPVLPTGGQVKAGSAVIGAPSGGALTINQSSSRAIIDWSSFSIGQAGRVQFDNGTGATLNRVTGNAGSAIDGLLAGTGSVYLINANGVIIGKSGVVNVGGTFAASTLDLTNSQFMSGGDLTFTGASAAAVINYGKIGALGGDVALIASRVTNDGQIDAANGDAGLISGYQVVLRDKALDDGKFAVLVGGSNTSATNAGVIQAADAELRANGGNVYALAGNTSAIIKATGVSASDGKVFLVAQGGTLSLAGAIVARGANGAGGSIETSGSTVDVGKANIDAGQGGSWLLDPVDLTIDQTAANTIQTSLGGGTNVTEQTTAAGSGGNGDIFVSPNVTINWNTSASLTLSAYRNISLGAGMTFTATGGGAVNLYADNTGDGVGTVTYGAGAGIGSNALTTITFDPSVNPAGSGVNATSYKSPTENYGALVAGSGGLATYMLVNTVFDLQNLKNNLSGTYALGRNIDASGTAAWNSGVGFSPIGSFSGVLSGQGFTVDKLTEAATTGDAGLFSQMTGSVSNLNLTNVNITDSCSCNFVGALAGYSTGSVSLVNVSGSISAPNANYVGGVVGYESNSINNSSFSGSVSGEQIVGGLAGYGEYVNYSSSSGSVTGGASAEDVGGLAGNGFAENSFSTGSVTTGNNSYYVGGLLGNGYANSSYSTGNVIVGTNSSYIGGLSGLSQGGSNDFSSGSVNAPGGTDVGGFSGYNASTISNSYSTSSVTASGGVSVGGFVGAQYDANYSTSQAGSIQQSYAANTVSAAGGTNVGAFVGTGAGGGHSGTITSSVYDSTVDGSFAGIGFGSSGGGLAGLTTSQMQDPTQAATNFAGWTFSYYAWSPPAAGYYPQLYGVSHVLFLTANNGSMTYGDPVPAFSFTAQGLQGGDTPSVVTGLSLTSPVTSSSPANASYVITASGGSAAGSTGAYRIIGDSNGSLYVNTRKVTLSLTGTVEKTYDGGTYAPFTSANFLVSNLVNGDVITAVSGFGTYASKNVGSGIQVTSNYEYLSGANASDYYLTTGSLTANIGVIDARVVTVALVNSVEKTYDGTTTATLDGSNYSISNIVTGDVGVIEPTSGLYADANAGTGKTVSVTGLSLSGADASNYTLSTTASGPVGIIDAKVLTASLVGTVEKTYDGTTAAALTASNYSLSGGVIGGDTVALNDPSSGTYDSKNAGSNKLVTASGLALTGASAGNYEVNAAASANIGIVDKLAISATLTSPVRKTYDGTTSASLGSNYVFTGEIAGDNLFLQAAAGAYDTKNAGSGKQVSFTGVSFLGADAGNYTIAPTLSGAVGQIDQLAIGVVLAGTVQKIYDGATAAILGASNYALKGVVTGDTVSVATTAGTYDTRNIGTAKTVTVNSLTLTGADAGNYSVSSSVAGAVGEIDPKTLTVSLTGSVAKTYDGTAAASLAGSNYGLGGVVAGDTVDLNDPGAGTYDSKNAGTGKTVTVGGLVIYGADAGNYIITPVVSGDVGEIDPKALTVSLTGLVDKTYDGTTSAILTAANYSVSGMIAGDTLDVTDPTSGTYDSKNARPIRTVSVTGIAISGADASNYAVNTSASGPVGEIDPLALTASLTGTVEKTYDGTVSATLIPANYVLSSPVGGDSVSLNDPSTGTYDSKNAGTGKTVTVGGLALFGADAANYTVNGVASASIGIIDPAVVQANSLTWSVANANSIYGTLAVPGAATLTGVLAQDAGNVSGLVGIFSGATPITLTARTSAGTYSETVTGLTGSAQGNYVLSGTGDTPGVLTISPKALTVSLVGVVERAYNGTTVATLAGSNYQLNGVLGGDSLNLNDPTTGTYADKNVGVNKSVSVTGLALSGAQQSDYTLNSPTASAAIGKIDPLAVTASLSGVVDKTYNGTTAASLTASNYVLPGIVAGDTVSLTDPKIGTYAGKDVGTNIQVTVSGAKLTGVGASNYTLTDPTVVGAVGEIDPKTLTASLFGAVVKTYDGTATATLAAGNYKLAGGVVAGDAITLNDPTTGAYADRNAGTAKIVTVSGVALLGSDAFDYQLASTTISAAIGKINPKALTASLVGTVSKVYDGTTTAYMAPSNYALGGVLSIDQSAVALDDPPTGRYNSAARGTGKTVTVTGLALTGSAASDYTVNAAAAAKIGTIRTF
jgi:filamentous hemagglutinin family protein